MKVIYVNHSIANRYSNHIEINKNLKKYPRLLKPILEHENSHSDDYWSIHDFKLDFFSDSGVNNLDLMKFMFKHPRSFYQLFPITYRRERGFIVDLNLLLMYLMMLVVFVATIYIGVKIL